MKSIQDMTEREFVDYCITIIIDQDAAYCCDKLYQAFKERRKKFEK